MCLNHSWTIDLNRDTFIAKGVPQHPTGTIKSVLSFRNLYGYAITIS